MKHAREFIGDFNAEVGRVRLLLLVSPTCAVCLGGVREVERSLGSTAVSLHVVWVKVLSADSEAAAETQAGLVSARTMATHYWDGDLELSSRFAEVLDLAQWNRSVAWDLYLLYDSVITFSPDLAPPTFWMQQLRIEEVPDLEGAQLLEEIERLSAQSIEPTGVPF